ncbi:MAG: hypothetical protein LBM27_02850 [Lactobacillaceae bacterium]|jgi:hypothetical protein|nr:hypothetical protein [Lactobacillaceae bacterium]
MNDQIKIKKTKKVPRLWWAGPTIMTILLISYFGSSWTITTFVGTVKSIHESGVRGRTNRTKVGDDYTYSDDYINEILLKDGTELEDKSNWLSFKFSEGNLYDKLTPGHTYKFTVAGFGIFPRNILDVKTPSGKEVPTRKRDKYGMYEDEKVTFDSKKYIQQQSSFVQSGREYWSSLSSSISNESRRTESSTSWQEATK